MNIFTNMASATRAALLYITVGSVTIVWTAMYYVYLNNHPPVDGSDGPWYWCTGFLLTGATVLVIGLAVGWIGRSARPAEQPHTLVTTSDSLGNPVTNAVPLTHNVAVAPVASASPINPVQPVVPVPARQNVLRS